MSVDIAYIVSHGFAARMVTQTNLLRLLREKGKSVALICPDKDDPNLYAYCRENDIRLVEFNARKGFGDENYMFKRKYFLEDIESNPALLDKHIHATRYNTSRHPLRRLRPYYYWLIYKSIPYAPFIRRNFIRRESRNLRSEEASRLIDELRPKRLVSTYPVNYNEAVLLHYGNRHKDVETWIHLLSWDNITCKGRWPETADKYIAWGRVMKDELQEYYAVKEENIFCCGVPHFDLHDQVKASPNVGKYLMELSLDPRRPYVLFAMSSPRFAPAEIDIVEWLAHEIAGNKTFGALQLIVRPHPQNVRGNLADTSWLSRLDRLNNLENVAVDLPELVDSKINWSMRNEDMVRLANLITGSLLVINSGSTVSIDGLVHHKPIIITSFDGRKELSYWKSARRLVDYPHLRKLTGKGGITVTRSLADLTNAVLKYMQGPDYLIRERIQTLADQLAAPHGEATNNVVNTLIQDHHSDLQAI